MSTIIGMVFDFDNTLTPDSTTAFLRSLKIEPIEFWRDVNSLVMGGWDPVPAYLYKMIDISKERKITREKLADFGRSMTFFNGVLGSNGTGDIFSRLRTFVRGIRPNIHLEFYLISSGIGEIVRNCSISDRFTSCWASEFYYGRENLISFPKNVISFTDKTRYLFHIEKGLIGEEYRGRPFDVNRELKKEGYHIPFRQMIVVGDGYTDIPCFSLVRRGEGVAIGVYDPEDPGEAWSMARGNRVMSLVPADYGKDSALCRMLEMALRDIIKRMPSLKSEADVGAGSKQIPPAADTARPSAVAQ